MFKKYSDKIDKISVLFFVFYILLCLFDITAPAKMYGAAELVAKAMRYLCYLVFALRAVYDIIKYRELPLVTVAAAALTAVNILAVGEKKLGFVLLALIAVRKLDVKKIIKPLFLAVSLFFITVVLLSAVGVIPDWTYMRDETVRHSLGFIYPTDAFSVLLVAVLLYFCAYRHRIKYYVAALYMAANVLMYIETDGRLSFILVTLAIISMVLYKILHQKKKSIGERAYKPLAVCLCLIPAVLLIASFVLVLLYKNETAVGQLANTLLSDRLKHGLSALSHYPIRLFGTFVEWVGFGGHGYVDKDVTEFVYNFVDMSFIRMALDFGIIVTAAVTVGYTKLVYDTVRKKDAVLTIILVIVLLWVFIEPYMFNIGRNVFAVYLAQYLNYGRIKLGSLKKG